MAARAPEFCHQSIPYSITANSRVGESPATTLPSSEIRFSGFHCFVFSQALPSEIHGTLEACKGHFSTQAWQDPRARWLDYPPETWTGFGRLRRATKSKLSDLTSLAQPRNRITGTEWITPKAGGHWETDSHPLLQQHGESSRASWH